MMTIIMGMTLFYWTATYHRKNVIFPPRSHTSNKDRQVAAE